MLLATVQYCWLLLVGAAAWIFWSRDQNTDPTNLPYSNSRLCPHTHNFIRPFEDPGRSPLIICAPTCHISTLPTSHLYLYLYLSIYSLRCRCCFSSCAFLYLTPQPYLPPPLSPSASLRRLVILLISHNLLPHLRLALCSAKLGSCRRCALWLFLHQPSPIIPKLLSGRRKCKFCQSISRCWEQKYKQEGAWRKHPCAI